MVERSGHVQEPSCVFRVSGSLGKLTILEVDLLCCGKTVVKTTTTPGKHFSSFYYILM